VSDDVCTPVTTTAHAPDEATRTREAHTATIPTAIRADVETLWAYHDLHHTLTPADVGIALCSHDLGVATCTADLYRRRLFPRIVFTGANAPTTIARFPRGEAVHYREHAIDLGVPGEAILVEPRATNTAENIRFTRVLLDQLHLPIRPQSSSHCPTSSAAPTPPPARNGPMSSSGARLCRWDLTTT
jgi:DUF218 domain